MLAHGSADPTRHSNHLGQADHHYGPTQANGRRIVRGCACDLRTGALRVDDRRYSPSLPAGMGSLQRNSLVRSPACYCPRSPPACAGLSVPCNQHCHCGWSDHCKSCPPPAGLHTPEGGGLAAAPAAKPPLAERSRPVSAGAAMADMGARAAPRDLLRCLIAPSHANTDSSSTSNFVAMDTRPAFMQRR
jgi:hypothetical protein